MGALARLLERQRGGAGAGTEAGRTASAGREANAPRKPSGRGRRQAGSSTTRRGRQLDLLHASGLSTAELRATWLAASWLLTYPNAEVMQRLPQLEQLVAPLPETVRTPLAEALARVSAMPDGEAEQHYVDTFDTRRRGCLYLTYFGQGDTRRRGMALVRIKQDFRAAGIEVGEAELPDHLPLVLEFAAAHDAERGAKILRQNRPGVELLRLHLAEIDSPWHGAVAAVCATLPPLDVDDRAAVLRLAEEGPPDEQVGLDGYGEPHPDSVEGAAAMMAARTASACSAAPSGAGAASGPVPISLTRGRPS